MFINQNYLSPFSVFFFVKIIRSVIAKEVRLKQSIDNPLFDCCRMRLVFVCFLSPGIYTV